MKNKKNVKFVLFMALTGAFIAFFGVKWHSMQITSSKKATSNFHQTQDYFANQLKNEEIQLWQELKQCFGVDLKVVHENQQNQWLQQNVNIPQKNEPIYKLIYEVAQEYNFNADKLDIVLSRANQPSPAYTNESGQLIVEMNLLLVLPENVQRFIIAHELHHILNDDFTEIRTLKRKIKKSSMTPVQQALFQKYERFQEKRADINAALKGKYWTEGYLAFTNEGLKRCTSDPGITHPTYKERKQIAQNILDHANGIHIA